jgi:hypothetical protein
VKPILDASGAVIGYENDVSPYRQETRGRAGQLFSTFNPKTGKTHDRSGRAVSNSGDVRASLIPHSGKCPQ